MISLRNFTIGYGKRILIADANARIEQGALTALIGRNGSGKSTLLRAIAGLGGNYSGEILLQGENRRSLTTNELAERLAYVSTERTRIPNMRCFDVVAMGRALYTDWVGRLRKADVDIVERSLAAVGMTDFADKTMDKMSDGECQRIMIARALAQDTPIMLLDEPTSFLDLPNRYELCSLLARLAHDEGKCIVFSTHELDIVLSLCDNVALVDTPRLVSGAVNEVVASGAIERLFHADGLSVDPLNFILSHRQ